MKSAVRSTVIEGGTKNAVVYSNTKCYRGLVPIEDIKAAGVVTDLTQRPVGFLGMDKVRRVIVARASPICHSHRRSTSYFSPLGADLL